MKLSIIESRVKDINDEMVAHSVKCDKCYRLALGYKCQFGKKNQDQWIELLNRKADDQIPSRPR